LWSNFSRSCLTFPMGRLFLPSNLQNKDVYSDQKTNISLEEGLSDVCENWVNMHKTNSK
jgi:hypothetical protein